MKKLNNFYRYFFYFLTSSFIIVGLTGCEKLIEVDSPVDQVIGGDVYNTPATAVGVLTGIYSNLSEGSFACGGGSVSVLTGFSSDEFSLFNINNNDFLERVYKNNLSATLSTPSLWSELYSYIFRVNSVIEGVSASDRLSINLKNQLVGEAKFLRAWFYFNLVNLYGDVPLILTTDYKITSVASRISKELVFRQIEQDLLDAKSLLNKNYVGSNGLSISPDRVRPNKSAASALLSRVYLYTKAWDKAEIEASELIDKSEYELISNIEQVFLKDSKEAIWQLQPVTPGENTKDGAYFIPTGAIDNVLSTSKSLRTLFTSNDLRKATWLDSLKIGTDYYVYPFKYKRKGGQDITEYQMVFRIAEQYLIRAEARANLGKLNGSGSAIEDINAIRLRAHADVYSISDKNQLLTAIYKERELELFSEGQRWFDLKRTDRIDIVMPSTNTLKGGNWQPYKQLYPIPQGDIDKNPNLRNHQNQGY